MKLTKAVIERLPAPDPSGKQMIHWDAELKGFGVLCSGVSATKSFVIQRGVNGRKRRITLGTVAEFAAADRSLEDIRTMAAERLLDLRHGKDPKARGFANVTLREALDLYLTGRPNLAEQSKAGYRWVIDRRFKKWLDTPLREISSEMIEARYRSIKEEIAAECRRGDERPEVFVSEPGSAGANAALRTLRAVWGFARARNPELAPWPAERLRGQWYRVGRREQHVPADRLKAFFDAVNERDEKGEYRLGRIVRDYIVLLLFTGMRRREAAALRWIDVDLGARVIRLSAKATKSKRRLDLPMSDVVHELLVSRRALGFEGDYVFPGPGKTKHLEEPKKAFARIAERSGVRISPHGLRSTFITITAGISMPDYVRKGLVNHSIDRADVTSGYVQEVDLRKGAQAVARAIKRHCGLAGPRGRNVRELRAPKKMGKKGR